jgi:hypothetical protein
MKALNVQIEDRQHEWIRRQAFERRMSMSDIVRDIITKSMKGESEMSATYSMKSMTTAERIAGLLGDDGMRWETEEGLTFDDLCAEAGAVRIRDDARELTRYEFPDGSAIVASPGAWDIEGSTPYSWAGAEVLQSPIEVVNPWSGATVGLTPEDVSQERLDAMAPFMDDEIREELHMELAPCSPFEFFRAYVEKVGEEEAGKIWFS